MERRPLDYNQPIRFEWDDAKSKACFRDRGFDFAYVVRAFFDPNRWVRQDNRRSYGEDRYQLMGKVGQRVFVVVYTPRRDTVRIISAHKANRREVKNYDNHPYDD